MSYAIRKDYLGWRAVSSEADVTEDEIYSATEPVLQPSITVDSLKSAVTTKRWEVETGGITLQDGTFVLSGIEDQNRVFNALKGYDIAPRAQVRFKGADGVFVWIEIAILRAIGTALANHTADCFEAEGAHYDAINALVAQYEGDAEGLQAALGSYDVSLGWPETELAGADLVAE